MEYLLVTFSLALLATVVWFGSKSLRSIADTTNRIIEHKSDILNLEIDKEFDEIEKLNVKEIQNISKDRKELRKAWANT